jgi:DDE superfamily endonuclease
MGLGNAPEFSLYHQVRNRARWSALEGSRRLLGLLVRTFLHVGGALTFVIEETLERRWGRRIRKRGHCRDPLASSKQRSVSTSGLRWIVLTLVITPPWTSRSWALPVLSVPAPTPEVSQRLGLRHKTIAQWARQMVLVVRRWLPGIDMTVIGDQTYSVLELGHACPRRGVRLIAPRRLDAALYEPAPPRAPGTNGRPRVKGKRAPTLAQVLRAACGGMTAAGESWR